MDPTTDLWALPIIGSAGKTSPTDTHGEQNVFDNLRDEFLERANVADRTAPSSLAIPSCASTQACATGKAAKNKLPNPHPKKFGLFTHIVQTKVNSIKFANQSLCSPTLSTILKAIRRGFLDGCPNLLAKKATVAEWLDRRSKYLRSGVGALRNAATRVGASCRSSKLVARFDDFPR